MESIGPRRRAGARSAASPKYRRHRRYCPGVCYVIRELTWRSVSREKEQGTGCNVEGFARGAL